MGHLLPTPTPRPHTLTPLRPMGIGILITDRGTIPATGTVVIMDPDIMVTTDVGGKKSTVRCCN
jgi:hypothetical protein